MISRKVAFRFKVTKCVVAEPKYEPHVEELKMAEEKKCSIETRKERFSQVKSLRAALNQVSNPMFHHDMYQHYTTLENVLAKISKGE